MINRRVGWKTHGARWLAPAQIAILAVSLCAPAGLQAAGALTFQTPATQSPGGAVVSEPTIRPFQQPGAPATFSTTIPVDFQGNGRPDLLACYVAVPPFQKVKVPCRVLRPQPDGSVIDVTRQIFGAGALPGMEAPREIVIGDFNGDGRPDIFIAAHGYDTFPFDGEVNVLLISNADGTYADRSSTLPQTPAFGHSACAGDTNGDGKPDIYVGNIGKVGPYVLLGRGDGTFSVAPNGLPPNIASMQENFLSCALVDLDGDGFADLVLGAANPTGSSNSIVLFNDGTGDFTKRPRYLLPTHPIGAGKVLVMDIVPLDVNRDGRPDLVVLATEYPNNNGAGLQVLINRGDGTFGDETATRLGASAVNSSGASCGFLRLADFNGDGWEDFYCNNGPQNVPNRYWMSGGDGTWSPVAPNLLSQGSSFGIHAVDFDGDGRPDLLQFSNDPAGDVFYKSFLNRTPRTVPSQPLVGAAISGNAQAAIFFSPPLGNGTSPVTGFSATCVQGTAAAPTGTSTTSPILMSGLTNGKSYSCSVVATSAAGIGTASGEVTLRPTSAATQAPVSVVDFAQGWNLAGSGSDASISVAATFADPGRFITVWKWVAAQKAWAFYAPSLAAQGGTVLADYVASNGYRALTSVATGEAFWVNTKQAASVSLPNGAAVSLATLGPTLIAGWNLVSIGQTTTPKQFCDAQTGGVTTLWAWDAATTSWYFYAPSLDANGGLASYVSSKGYRDFAANGKTLGQGIGFWVNKP